MFFRRVLTALIVLLWTFAAHAQEPTFPAWSTEVMTWDAVGMLSAESKQHIAEIQKTLKEKHQVGLWVVLIDGQSRYCPTPMPIQQFALSLARQKIRPLAGNDDFVLLLVCKEDRRSRIELGTNWDNEWNQGCDLITANDLVANFKQGQYEQGVVKGVEALSAMVEAKNDYSFTGQYGRLSTKWGSQLGAYSYVPPIAVVPMAVVGVLLTLLGLVIAAYRTPLAGSGMALVVIAIFSQAAFWILLAVGVIWLLSKLDWSSGSGYSSWDSDSSSSGFFSSSSSSFFSSSDSSSSSSWGSSDSSWSSSSDSSWGSGGGSTGEW